MKIRPSIALFKDNQVLLLKYNYSGHEVYGLPGGNPDDNETLEQTVVREVKEELNIDIKVEKLIIAGEVIFEEKNMSTLHCIFIGKMVLGDPNINPAHTTALSHEWLDLNDIATVNMYPNVGKFIKTFISGSAEFNPYVGRIDQKWF